MWGFGPQGWGRATVATCCRPGERDPPSAGLSAHQPRAVQVPTHRSRPSLGAGLSPGRLSSVWTVSLPTGRGFHSSRLWWRWVGGPGVEVKGRGSQRGAGGRGLPHRPRVLPLFWKLLLNWDTHPHPSSSPPAVCLMRKPFWPSQLKVPALRLITAKPRTKEVKAGSLGLPSTWRLPLGVCVSEARPLNRAVFSVLVKQSRAASLPGLSPPFSSFLRD